MTPGAFTACSPTPPARPDAGGQVAVSLAQHRWYRLGLPTVARLTQCPAAARAGRPAPAAVAAARAIVSLLASLPGGALLLYAGWLAAQHRDAGQPVLLALAALTAAGTAGVLAELPRLGPAAGAYRGRSDERTRPGRRPVAELADAVLALGRVAMAFGRTNRITYHDDGLTPESDTDHTVMLALVACALAVDEPRLDVGLVAQFAVVHDLVEVYAGDVPTLRALSSDAKADKKRREAEAYERLRAEFGEQLPWLPETIHRYEQQDTPEARFVRAVDKLMPKLTHMPNNCCTLHEQGTTVAELADRYTQQREDELAGYAGDFPLLLALHADLAGRVVALYRQQALAS